ncbi:MAG: YceI family protein [Pseudomonadota bacterium]|nr:YceI family protein [Pseudomonadota bacterium]
MQRNFTLITALLSLPLCPVLAATESYTLDPNHSYVAWGVSHFGFSDQVGKWYVNGTIDFDAAKPQNSKVNVTIKVDEIVTGLSEFDKHLKGKLFFDTSKYPTATFVSDKINVTGDKSAKIQGTLTVHGVSKSITLDVKLNKKDVNPLNNKPTLGFSATTNLKRSDYNIKTLLPSVGDDVQLMIQVEANKGM